MNKLVIYGKSYLDLIKLIDAINRERPTWEVLGFIDDDNQEKGNCYLGVKVLGGRELIPELVIAGVSFFNNVSGHWSRNQYISELLLSYGCMLAQLIHPSVDLNYVRIGSGCIIPDGCIIGGNTKLGDFVTLRLRVLVSHDVHIGNHVIIGPGAVIASHVKIGSKSFIGAGATILPGVSIGEGSIVGAGAVVTKDVAPEVTVIGVPAKEMFKKG